MEFGADSFENSKSDDEKEVSASVFNPGNQVNFRDLSAIDQHVDDSKWMNDITIEDDSCKI